MISCAGIKIFLTDAGAKRARRFRIRRMFMLLLTLALVSSPVNVFRPAVGAHARSATAARWRAATPAELRKVIPAGAPVVKENIETEFRTAAGITDGRGRFIAGVVMITAGYSADGKYSHYFVTQVPLRVEELELKPGAYAFGYRRGDDDTLRVTFYSASSGEEIGTAIARIINRRAPVRSFGITPAGDEASKPMIQLG